MEKKDLKSGMIVITRRGASALVVVDNCYGEDAIIFSDNNWTSLNNFSNDLIWHKDDDDRTDHTKSVDIMKIYRPDLPTGFLTRNSKLKASMELIWERKESIPELTMDEAIEKMGFEFKIKQ